MDITQFSSLLPAVAAIAYLFLLLRVLLGSDQQGKHTRWFLGFLGVTIIWQLLLFLAQQDLYLLNLPVKAITLGTLVLSIATTAFLNCPQQRRWLMAGGYVLLLALLLDAFFPVTLSWLPADTLFQPMPGSILALLLWIGSALIILTRSWQGYGQARLPWHANRLLHWLVFALVTLVGEGLFFSRMPWVNIGGQVVRFVGTVGLSQAIVSHRLFDVRARLRKVIALVVIALSSAVPATIVFLGTLGIVDRLELPQASTFVLILMLLSLGFLLYQPFRRLVEQFLYRYLLGQELQANKVVRRYTQAISRTLDVDQLSLVIITTISELLQTTRGALMLVSPEEDGYVVDPIPALGRLSRQRQRFPGDSVFIEALATEQHPILQYDLDFNPDYAGIEAGARTWLSEQGMEVYVPVHSDSDVTGFIALGPKSSGFPYRPGELELVQLLADQTVIALQNARLYSELNQQHDQIRHLNIDLRQQNKRLETLDRIKSDFITIASHELRTPLTQVKGYADILLAMNEEAALTPKQTREIAGHINRASMRLETLITAMLDASQLEVSGIQLSLMQTRLETVVRLAIEPLAQAFRQRRIHLEIENVESIPPIRVDLKRLVQAFQNVISNAIKYTPDHGTINLRAQMAPSVDGTQYVEVVVADTGIGIDPEYHDLIFEKFFRIGNPELHSTGSTKFKGAGPGLGLHIAKGVIEAHGGRIWVDSEGEDEERLPGSRFYLVLPLNPPGSEKPEEIEGQPAWLVG